MQKEMILKNEAKHGLCKSVKEVCCFCNLPHIYFDEKDLNILTMVKQYYFDVYSAKALEEICHKEEPYRKAREGCRDGEICNAVINKKNIALYYDRISREYDIGFSSMVNVKKYLNLILG